MVACPMEPRELRFTLIRTDLLQDAVVVLGDSLLIGRLRECELLLNHPRVSRVQAGIKVIAGYYYIFNLRTSNPVHLNGKPITENDCLAAGDRLAIGPFLLDVDINDKGLVLEVSLQIGVSYQGLDAADPALETEKADAKKRKRAAPLPADKALDVFWEKRMREVGKIVRPSPLFPTSQRRAGKTQSVWTSTTDLARRWPVSFLIWGTIIGVVPVVVAACWFANAYAPAPVARVHAQKELRISPPIAVQASANSCTTCHSLTLKMETQCANCHHTDAFVATIVKGHSAAGISCVNCHPEHRGADFRVADAAVLACTQCHNDANNQTYNGYSVGTPHGGTFGYPVLDGKWVWKGLDDAEWALKEIKQTRLPTQTDEQWRSTQFHAIHVLRVRAVPGIKGDPQGLLWCNACHEPMEPPSRTTPRTKCGLCHGGRIEVQTGRVLIAADKPNCTSCHIQHAMDKRNFISVAIRVD
ncbi:MAG TPA: hypothetical protein DC054_01665 [Blastocatellia bacterium]|nr:hypothetical protein [Blastocatellia bacterium]